MKHDKPVWLLILQWMIITGLFMMEMNDHQSLRTVQWGLFSALFVITAILLFMRLRFIIRLQRVAVELKGIIHGNLKTRLFGYHDRLLDSIILLINELIERIEKVNIQTIQSQSARRSLLSSISHDIRTPLTSIIGYVDALKDDIATSEEEQREHLEIVSRKSHNLKKLIDDIFNMAKIDADEIQLKTEALDFAEMTRELLIEFIPEIKKWEIELKVEIPEKHCTIIADRQSLVRVIRNIMKNALLYGKEGKVLGIELVEAAREYRLPVLDRGPGISKKDIGNVFERMYRSDSSRPLNGGSGLGLAIAKALVEKHGGRIWAESIPWEKTTFGFSIPKSNKAHHLRNN
ncbi:sensor histidine kinase [Paludifilum halophilum]|uniref:histidine kinase n=1 Tax=Paludifilum halophilum TaxID=1642702 RepID=A0A235B4H7_9BACL|nr:HAMP domain-containing sensor histidine kinase [Paludifilum halophilum]OYD07141.1 two-component sensor histidine kinase [Paludifilum halophilum]